MKIYKIKGHGDSNPSDQPQNTTDTKPSGPSADGNPKPRGSGGLLYE